MIRKISLTKDSQVINDVDISKKPDFRGNQVEPNQYFTVFSNSREPQYESASEQEFRPQTTYIMKQDGRRKKASPKNLGLYIYNGLDYIQSRDVDFKEGKEYFLFTNNQYVKATPRNCQLEIQQAPLYSYYDIAFNGIQILHFDGNDFERCKEAYDWCIENTEEIKQVYDDAINYDMNPKQAIVGYISDNSDFVADRINQNYSIRANTAERTTATRRQNRTATPFGNPMIVNPILEKYNLSYSDIDPKENANMNEIQLKAQREAFGYTIYYENGYYYINPLRIPNTILGNQILNSYDFKNQWYRADSINELLRKVKKLQEILQDFKDNKIDRQDMLKKLNVTDSKSFITYEMKDGKKIVTGVYDSLKEAQLADEDKLVQKYASLGIYQDESDGKFLAKPKDKDGKLVRLGKFEDLNTARNASLAFMKSNKDIEQFFESDFYASHINECQEAYDYYKKDYSKERKETDPYVTKNEEGTFRVEYKNSNGDIVIIANDIKTEARAKQILEQAMKSGNLEEFINRFHETKSDINEEIEESGVTEHITSNPQTYSENKNLRSVINNIAKNISDDEVIDALSGPRNDRGKIYNHVIELLKRELTNLGYSPEAVETFSKDYGNQFGLQGALMKRAYLKLFYEGIDDAVETSKAQDYKYNQNEFANEVLGFVLRHRTFNDPTYDKNNVALKKKIGLYYPVYMKKMAQ